MRGRHSPETHARPAARPKWFAANEANFGYLESLGDDWGQKGVFKSTLRIVLFGD